MKWTGLNEIREKYLSFFESKGHLRLPSYPLIPNNDKSLLLINSGMAPMKKFFTGEEEPPRRRVTTCQKCIRTPDLERVGHTARHGTYFEMLGNFSFGDYFKEEAIPWAWEFLTEVMEIPAELLWPSIYEDDDEAFEIWNKKVGVPAEHIVRLGKEDNFWEHGTGPCGPCSEIYFDRGEKYGCGSPDCKPGCDCDRFMEIWNNVFSQFDNKGDGTYEELAQKNIDTGMGLDRLACVMQGVDNMFEVDTTKQIVDKVVAISGKPYGNGGDTDVSVRVVTDHARSASFMICDGVIPSNEGRGYVLRRILRRASRHGKLLGIDRPFLTEICDVVIATNEGAYPELRERADYIKKVISIEEERFDATIDSGLGMLRDLIAKAKAENRTVIDGEEAFRLYDTFGFPIDLTKEIAAEQGVGVDEEVFAAKMQEQKVRAREARANVSGWDAAAGLGLGDIPKTVFDGYGHTDLEDCKILAILYEGEPVDRISEGECTIVLAETSFYGEGGGQIGDTGVLIAQDENGETIATAEVYDTKKQDGVYLHLARMTSGVFEKGYHVRAVVDEKRRLAIARNHSGAHLLQAALRQVLGTHVEQAGSYVDAERLRFDFTHFQAVTPEELAKAEALVNEEILRADAINTIETDPESAKRMGAMALFGEKYGKSVRMVKMGDFSTELCGGTHMNNTARLGLFRILSECSVAAGVRRIEATTGEGVLALLAEKEQLLADTAKELKAPTVNDVAKRAAAQAGELRETKRELEQLAAKLAAAQTGDLAKDAVPCGPVRLVLARLDDMTADAARTAADGLRDANPDLVVVIGMAAGDKVQFVAACGKDAIAHGAHAGNLIREVSKRCGGGGGGRPDSAQAGGKDVSALNAALEAVPELLGGMLK